MTHKHKGLIYTLKKLDSKGKAGKALRMQVLRCVLAVGFALSPWLGGEAFADGIVPVTGSAVTFDENNTAHIYVQSSGTTNNNVGLNKFTDFNVDSGQTANLYFKTEGDNPVHVDTLVNTVQNQISINGTVNAIKNDAVGGHLYFISPNGMVVGANGVINAGALTMIGANLQSNDTTPNQYFETADKAAAYINQNSFDYNGSAGINIQGKINTITGIDLRAAYINMTKAAGGASPYLKTGMVFNTTVSDGNVTDVGVSDKRLTLGKDTDGNFIVYDPDDSNVSFLGDGGIKLSTSVANSGNVTIANGTLGAVGNLSVEAGQNINIQNTDIVAEAKTIHALAGNVSITDTDDYTITLKNADIDAGGSVNIIANDNEDHSGTITLIDSTVDAGNDIFFWADRTTILQNTSIHTDSDIEIRSKWYERLVGHGGTLSVYGGSIRATGNIDINTYDKMELKNNGIINSSNGKVTLSCILGEGSNYYGDVVLDNGSITATSIKCEVGQTITINEKATIEVRKSVSGPSSIDRFNISTQLGDIINKGEIKSDDILNITAGNDSAATQANIINNGIISTTSDGVTVSLTARNGVNNTNTIQASGQIAFTVGGTLTNQGKIQSTSSNVQAHIGRDFKNNAVYGTDSSGEKVLKGGIITAGGNVQVDYTLPSDMKAVSTGSAIDGIYNSGLIEANGDVDPTYDEEGKIQNEGSGNIWLTSNYNITNRGTMDAGRQITLNARDFLHNYGTIEGETYLDIKSIMGYVYNHDGAKIISTGGNIALSSGQENLSFRDNNGEISPEEQEAKKELYRKFTPIIIEGIVKATSDDNNDNQTKEGNIKITAHLGDIYINGGTIETKPETNTSGEVVAKAGDVILKADQNITIGFNTVSDSADDPTTDKKDDREYYKPLVENGNLASGNASTISGSNVTLSAGSINNDNALIGGNLTLDPKTSVILGGSLQLQGNNITVADVQRSGNPTEPLKVEANGAGGTDSAINSLNLNIAGDALFNTLNVTTADVNVSGDLQIKQLHVVDQAHFTSNNTIIGVYGEATEPRGDQSDALYRDMGNGSDSWMSISMDSKGYEIKNGSEIKSVLGDGTEDPVQMSSKLVDVDTQEPLVENYGDVTGNFGRFDLVDDSTRPSGGIESTDQGSQTVLKQDENGLHIETSDNKVENGPQIEAGDNKVDNGTQIEAGDNKVDNGPQTEAGDNKVDNGTQIEAGDNKVDNGTQIEAGDNKGDQGSQIEASDDKGDQGSQIEASDDKGDNGSKIEAGDDKEDEDSQLEAGDKKKDKSKRDKKDKREKKNKNKEK